MPEPFPMRLFLRPILFALALTLGIGAAHAQQTLYFSAIPDEDETRLTERFGTPIVIFWWCCRRHIIS